jgi:hypothetical protein
MATRRYFQIHLDSTSTSPKQVTSKSSYITSVVISCSNAGTAWLLHIQDGVGKILIPPFTLSVPTDGLPNVNVSFDEPQVMRNGVYILWPGSSTPGVADVRISCNVTEEE